MPDAATVTRFANFRVTGPWNGTTVIDANGIGGELILTQQLARVHFVDLVVEYSVNQGIQASQCRHVRCSGCTFQFISRDGFNFSASALVEVIGNTVNHCDDNAISGHANWGQSWGVVSDLVCSGNRIEDAYGMSFQGVKRASIEGNVLTRCRGTGIEVAYVGVTAAEGNTPPVAVRIAGNVITDVINAYGLDGEDNEGHYIIIGCVPPSAGNAGGIPGLNTTIIPASWAPSATVKAGMQVIDTNGNIQQVTTAGTTGASAPSWNATVGGTTTDNTATWTNEGSGIVAQRYPPGGRAWSASTPCAIGNILVDGNGNVQRMAATSAGAPASSGTSGASTPAWASAYGNTTTDNQITWKCLGTNSENSAVLPYAYLNVMRSGSGDVTTPMGPGYAIDIVGNTCARMIDATLPQQYSALGFGQMFSRDGWLNPSLGTQELVAGMIGVDLISTGSPAAIVMLRALRIADNTIVGLGDCVRVGAGVRLGGAEILRNRMLDFLDSGVLFADAYAPHRVLIDGN
ncbi:MAG: right-handed parallel beta-helix repeat-containing protein, partial [Trebonia sp.]